MTVPSASRGLAPAETVDSTRRDGRAPVAKSYRRPAALSKSETAAIVDDDCLYDEWPEDPAAWCDTPIELAAAALAWPDDADDDVWMLGPEGGEP